MLRSWSLFVCLSACLASSAFATVKVTSPSNGATYSGAVRFAATATTKTCAKGIASIGIYTAPYQLAYVKNGSSLDTTLALSPGTYDAVVEEWDNCGGATTAGVAITVQASGTTGVYVSSPADHSTVGSPANFSATATTSCDKGVSAIGIYTAPYQLAYVAKGATLDYNLALNPGTYHTVVEEWDGCGGAATTPVTITVAGTPGGTFTELQKNNGWADYGQRGPSFIDCSPSPCDEIEFSLAQNVNSPSRSGAAMETYLSGNKGYGDALFNNHLIGDDSSQGLPDKDHSLIPQLHNFTYDVYFYIADLGASQALEFDINQFFDNKGWIWGHQCTLAGANEWDIWDNLNSKWVPTGISCNPVANSWNHLTIQVQRTSSDQLLYKTITLNGQTSNVNAHYQPGSAVGWYGVTVNYQQDGNYEQSPYSVYLDDLTFTYN
jgi:hypothetical protein